MGKFENLPFARGETYFAGDTNTATSTIGDKLLGQEYIVTDQTHGTNLPIRLRVVQNLSNASILTGRGVTLSTGASYGKSVTGYGGAQGAVGILPVDDAYTDTYSIINNDIFYVVVDGPVHVKAPTGTATTIVVGSKLTWGATGHCEIAADLDEAVLLSQGASTPTQTNHDVLCIMGGLAGNF